MADVPVAILTGGAQGLGAAICTALLKQGYKVCVADIQEDKGNSFVKEQQKVYGKENLIFSFCDVTKESDFEATFDLTIKAFRKVDVLINNAGISFERDAKKLLDVNLMGPIIGCRTAFKFMGKSNGGKGGIVINTASILGFFPFSTMPIYTATKHGVIGLTRSYGLPCHFDKEGIIFAALCPSFIDTELLKSSLADNLRPGEDFKHQAQVMSVEYVAQGVVKLLKDRINGSTLLVEKASGYQYIGYQEEFKNTVME